jgi:hypothetical protein
VDPSVAIPLPASPIELALGPLDQLRTRVLRATMPWSSHFAARREARTGLIGALAVLAALLGTAIVPLWMLALGPIVLGVPHLLADLRYCVIRTGWHRRPALWLGVGLPAIALMLGAPLVIGFAALFGAAAASHARSGTRRIAVYSMLALAFAGFLALGPFGALVLVHLHNFVAVLLWARWRRREHNHHTLVLLAFAFGSLVILLGGLDPLIDLPLVRSAPVGVELRHHLQSLTGGLEGPLALRLVLLFAFAQSVHYGVWLRMVPEDDRDRPTPRSFRASWRALVTELGPVLPWLAITATLALASWALIDLAAARTGYLRFASFHGFLELALLTVMVSEGRRFVHD